jgi:hypothetical protein
MTFRTAIEPKKVVLQVASDTDLFSHIIEIDNNGQIVDESYMIDFMCFWRS